MEKPFETFSGEAVYRYKTKKGLLKLYSAFDNSNFQLIQEDINSPEGVDFKLNNSNLYFNGSYTTILENKWTLATGFSYTYSKNKINIDTNAIDDTENSIHTKLKLRKSFSNRFKLNFGAEYFTTHFNEVFLNETISSLSYGFKNNILAAFAEADVIFSKQLALKAGLRTEYSELFKEINVSPRISLAYKTGAKSQMSLAYGDFYQNPNSSVLKFEQNLKAQQTQHYILNYQYNNDGRIFRAETYFKNYSKLVKYDTEFASFDTNFNNAGNGFR